MDVIVKEIVEVVVPVESDEAERRREILLRAAELIEKRGYAHGTRGMAVSGPFCLLGAVSAAMDAPIVDNVWDMEKNECVPGYAYEPAEELIGSPSYSTGTAAWQWSDLQQAYLDPAERVARALRKLAHGTPWSEIAGK